MADPATPPPGCQPLFLATQTCEIFQLKPGTDVTAEQPIKKLAKAQLLADIAQRRAVSDFQPYKDIIEKYPGDELVVVFDAEWVYGQNFYFCVTADAAENILHPKPSTAEQRAAAEAASGPAGGKGGARRTGPWVSLGSDKEIDAEKVVPRSQPLKLWVSRPVVEFRKEVTLSDTAAEDSLLEFKFSGEQLSDVKKVELSAAIQAIPTVVDAESQTTWNRPVNFAMQYEPNTCPPEMIRLLESTPEFQNMTLDLAKQFEWAVRENSMVDLLEDQYALLDHEEVIVDKGVHVHLPELQSFTDLKHTKNKSVSCVEWHPSIKGIVAIACTPRNTLDEKIEQLHRVKSKQSLIAFWSLNDPLRAQLFLEAPEDVLVFKFHPKDPCLVYAGCTNGQIAIWDITEHQERLRNQSRKEDNDIRLSLRGEFDRDKGNSAPVVRFAALSAIEATHQAALTDLNFLPAGLSVTEEGELQESTNDNIQFVTTSLDGESIFWNSLARPEFKAAEANWRPVYRITVTSMDATYEYGCTKLSLTTSVPRTDSKSSSNADNKPILSTKFFCATEEGDLIYGSWIPQRNKEDKECCTESVQRVHFGAISDLQRSPFFNDIVISTGGWSFHVWKETLSKGPLLSYDLPSASITVAQWSLTRPGVVFIGRTDGILEIWDLLDRCDAPFSTQAISAHPIASISISFQTGKKKMPKQLLAIGDDFGTLFVMDIPKRLSKAQKNEVTLVKALFDREVKRLGYISEQKVKDERRKDAAPKAEEPNNAQQPKKTVSLDKEKIEKDYVAMEKNFMDSIMKNQGAVVR